VAIAETPEWKDVYPVHCAAQMGDAEALAKFIDESDDKGAHILVAKDDDGWAPIHYSAWYNHLAAVRVLLAAAAASSASSSCVNVTNAAGATPLHFAAGAGHPLVVAALLQAGADRTISSAEKQTPAQLAEQLQPPNVQEVLALLNNAANDV
jgi:ankyrin repeat protein